MDMGEVISGSDVDLGTLTAPFPRTAIKQRTVGGGRSLSYVEGHTVIHRLNAATNNCWDMQIMAIDSMAIGNQLVLRAHVRLSIPGLGSREHIGVQSIADRAGEDLVKGAVTDALKKCATLFGVGLELYGPDYGSGEIEVAPEKPKAQAPAKPEGSQVDHLLKAGKDRGLTKDQVLSVAQSVVGTAALEQMPREQAVKLWAFICKAENEEIQEAVSAGEFERKGPADK